METKKGNEKGQSMFLKNQYELDRTQDRTIGYDDGYSLNLQTCRLKNYE